MAETTVDALVEVLGHLSAQQTSALERVLEQAGQSCGVSQQYVKALADRGLLTLTVDALTHDTRLCEAGCGHVWYEIPAQVEAAYTQWAAQWEDGAAQEAASVPAPTEPPRPVSTRRPTRPQYWVRFTLPGIGYFTYRGTNYDRGQLLDMPGGPRDEQLERLGFVQPAPVGDTYLQAQCGACQAWFLNEAFRDAHGRLRHRQRFQGGDPLDVAARMDGPDGGAALVDTTGDAEERRMQADYPLFLERTKATLNG